MYYNLNKVSLSRGGSYIDSSKWLKNKKATIIPKNNDGKCRQYALTIALNYEQIKDHPERISKIKHFIDQCNWKEIDFPSHGKGWKKCESNNESIALNILCVCHNTEKIRHAYKSKYNLNRKNQVVLLMITDGEKHKKVRENHDYCYVEMPEDCNKILKYNKGEKSKKSPFIIYADVESLL